MGQLGKTCVVFFLLVVQVGCIAPWLTTLDVETFGRGGIEVLDNNNALKPIDSEIASVSDLKDGSKPLLEGKASTERLADSQPNIFDDFDRVFPFFTATRSYIQAREMYVERVLRFNPPGDVVENVRSNENDELHTWVDVSLGARYLELDDAFGWQQNGGLLGEVVSRTNARNQCFGPQLGLRTTTTKQNWEFTLGGNLLVGMAMQGYDQTSQIGGEVLPASINRPIYGMPTISNHEQDAEKLSSIGELLAQATYQLNDRCDLQFGYSNMMISGINYAEESVLYTLPSFGIDSTKETRSVRLEGVFARLEYRR